MIICLKCGTKNPPTNTLCQKCKVPLPKMPADYEAPRAKATGRLDEFKQAVVKVKSGQMAPDEFSHFLNKMINTLTSQADEIRSIEIPPEMAPDFENELTYGFEGMQLYEQGLDELKLYTSDKNTGHLDKGLAFIEEGNNKLNEAMRINRENRSKMEELYNPDLGPMP